MIDIVSSMMGRAMGGWGSRRRPTHAQGEMQNIMSQMMRAMKAIGMISVVPSDEALESVRRHRALVFL